MYKTPKIKSELYDIPNTIGENNKAKANPSLPRKPDFPEVDVSDLTETTIDKLSSREAARADILNKYNSGRKNATVTYPLPIVHDDKIIMYGLVETTASVSIVSETAPTSVTRTIYGGYRKTEKVEWISWRSEYWRDQNSPVHSYYLYAGKVEELHQTGDDYWVTDYFVSDASLIPQVNLVLGDQSQEYPIPLDKGFNERGELILQFVQTYTDYTKILSDNVRDEVIIETTIGGRQEKTIENMGEPGAFFIATSEDPPNTPMPNPDDEGNYSVDIDVVTDQSYNIVIRNYSVYPRLIRIRMIL